MRFLFDRHDPLADPPGGTVARAGIDGERPDQQRASHLADFVGERGREQQGLALPGQRSEHGIQFAREAEVEHAVGLVEHQRPHLAELERVLAMEVEQAAGRGDQDIDALAQGHHLRIDADPAVGGQRAQRQVLAVAAEAGMHLLGEFARRHQNEDPRAVGGDRRRFAGQALQQRQREAGGLAGAGLRRRHQVAPGEDGRDGLRLYRGGCLVAQGFQGAQQTFAQSERGESRGLGKQAVPPSSLCNRSQLLEPDCGHASSKNDSSLRHFTLFAAWPVEVDDHL